MSADLQEQDDPQAARLAAGLCRAQDLSARQSAWQDGDVVEAAARLRPVFPTLEAWVVGYFAPTYARRATPTFKWCAQWWRHAEAIARLEALWRPWEELRLHATTGPGTWFREHLDHQLPILTGAAGPFADCNPQRHFAPELDALPIEEAPPGWWPSDQPLN